MAEAIVKDIRQFPWSYEYKDFISSSSDWLIKGCQNSGFVKFIFYSGEVQNINNLLFTYSVMTN